jgi:opacity protein-like surface antigen
MAAIYSNGGNRWNILGFNFTKRDVLSSVYKISMAKSLPQSRSEYAKSAYRLGITIH